MESKKQTFLPCLFHWVEVNTTKYGEMVFTTAQYKMDHGIEYAHFEKIYGYPVERNLCGWCLN